MLLALAQTKDHLVPQPGTPLGLGLGLGTTWFRSLAHPSYCNNDLQQFSDPPSTYLPLSTIHPYIYPSLPLYLPSTYLPLSTIYPYIYPSLPLYLPSTYLQLISTISTHFSRLLSDVRGIKSSLSTQVVTSLFTWWLSAKSTENTAPAHQLLSTPRLEQITESTQTST